MSNRLSLLLWGEALRAPRINELLVDALADLAQPFTEEGLSPHRCTEVDTPFGTCALPGFRGWAARIVVR